MTDFVHLHVHTEYSMADGLVRIGPLMKAVATASMPAVALTDLNNVCALVKFYSAAVKQGIKPILGTEIVIADRAGEVAGRVVLLCQDDNGYRNLTRLLTRAYQEGQAGGVPMIERDWLAESNAGLIALSGARDGDVGKALIADSQDQASEYLDYWLQHFPDRYYLELQRTGRADEDVYLHAAVGLAATRGVPVVATNDVRFLRQDDFEAHEARVCIHDGRTLNDPRRTRLYSDQQYLRSPAEMVELFSDIPEALQNSVEIARRCNLSLTLDSTVLPEFPIPDGLSTDEYFREKAHKGLNERLATLLDADADDYAARRDPYVQRLERELDVITGMGFPGYFLIVADFIEWARNNGVPVGPGRGSGAGSLVAYSLRITDIDPLAYDLLFERFLNPERVSMPDFDIDFCMDGRDRVIEYVAERYGRDRVSQIITHGTMAAKAVVRDAGRVLGHPYGFVDRIAKMIPFEIGMTLEKALKQEPELRETCEQEEEVRALMDLAQSLEGITRNVGKHAGGVVISPSPLTDFTPLYCEPGGQGVVTHLDKDDVEKIGLVKFDFLGLRTLTIIDRAVSHINEQLRVSGEPEIDIDRIPLDDVESYKLLQRQETTAVFQLESRGIKDLIKRLAPDHFEDVVALVALYRPGPLQSGMVEDFIDRKHGRQRVNYPHPALEPILQPTYGVILYQEQVMQIAQVLAGYTLGGADMLRRAMGKKKPEEMAKQREVFQKGAAERDVDPKVASGIFDLMEKFAGYGFNKSHSVAYALLAYQTAWLKAHYPAAFMAAVLSADMDTTDKVVNLIDECRSMRLEVLQPDVSRSRYSFTAVDNNSVVYGLGAIKGVGQSAIENIVTNRDAGEVFSSLDDVCQRCDVQRLNRRMLEALVSAGALDSIGPNRATLMSQIPTALQRAEQRQRDSVAGQNDMFGESAADPVEQTVVELPEWDEPQLWAAEKEALGLYLTGHPIDRYQAELQRIAGKRIGELSVDGLDSGRGYGNRGQPVVVAGLIHAIRTRNSQSGRIAFVTLDDRSGRLDVAFFTDEFRQFSHLLITDKILVVEGSLAVDDFNGGLRMRAKEVMDIDQARDHFARKISISVRDVDASNGFIGELQAVLSPFREGRCQVQIDYVRGDATVSLAMDQSWRVTPREELLQRLRALPGIEDVDVVYQRAQAG